jgi:predicted nucleic acid-binding protein
MIHLDTSFLIRSFVPNSPEEARMRHWLSHRADLAVSTVCWTEFMCGPVDVAQVPFLEHFLGTPAPFVREDADRAAEFFNTSGRRRGSLMDCMIAAVAVREGASLATSNASDFSRFHTHGLRLEPI